MPTLMRIALWIVAGVLALLALTKFFLIESGKEDDSDLTETQGDAP
ncbi:MAG: hypothetical protein OXI52_04535 [Caldilineaceae bacterium]|nr:hypothetical protein [Caldilineaceae bacterium]